MATTKSVVGIVLLLCCCSGSFAGFYLKSLSYTKLPATISPTETFKMFAGTAEEAAYDPTNEMLYVVGEDSGLMHVIDVSNPESPRIAATHTFSKSADGKPRDVAVCGTEVAVVLSSPIKDVYEGHVYFFHTLTRAESQLQYDGKLPVGPHPDMITFNPTCTQILVANEGQVGLNIANQFSDPPGTVTIIQRERYGNPSEQTVDFSKGEGQYNLRRPSYYIPPNIWPSTPPTFTQDAEPEYIVVSPDGRVAYIILQKNNAIAKLDLKTFEMKSITAIPRKEWRNEGLDPSDRDGGAHLSKFPLFSIKQPDNTKILTVGKTNYLITADEGHYITYTRSKHGFDWSDHKRADLLTRGKKFDENAINNQTFIAQLTADSKAGRLQVSQTEGYNPFTQKLSRASHFGGRGFSIWNADSLSLIYDSKDEIEKKTDLLFPDVFNSDCIPSTITYQSPANLKDTTSDDMGPKLNALDVVTDNEDTFLLTGSETSGVLFLYSVNTTSGYPIPKFESAHRAGLTDYVWSELYEMNEAGDAQISSIGIIKSSEHRANKTMAYVVGSASGTVSLYEIKRTS
ncbi:mesenchyme-specific cell surface glycoprotein-like [Mytilus californianus]|uniref:mesenchyme-specific cell surface glycoprotein-like n=1 Tax=Mytilus californianus TaxID=6549 RepID=UPI002247E8B0|nr:mesenchyme-specific cell surface glycoprotein-like [Mytilus californianus]